MIRVCGCACAALACAAQVLAQPSPVAVQPERQKLAPAGLTNPAIRGLQGFSVVLVLGDLQGSATADNIPAAARKALADMKDFLPYKSYRLLDSAWILGSENLSGRLRGPEDQEYELGLRTAGASGAAVPGAVDSKALLVEFLLWEPGETPKPSASGDVDTMARVKAKLTDLAAERAKLDHDVQVLEATRTDKHPDTAKAKAALSELNRQIAEWEGKGRASIKRPGSRVISTGFSMDVGETVVVGTSRLRGGDKALIALLTAVPRK